MRLRILCIGVIGAVMAFAAPRATITGFYNYPNPFRASETATTFKVTLSSASMTKINITVFGPQGKPLFAETSVSNTGANPYLFNWRGVDDKGTILSPGLYQAKVEVRTTDGDVISAFTKVVVK